MGRYRITIDVELSEELSADAFDELGATLEDADILFCMLEQLGIQDINDETVTECVGDCEKDPRLFGEHWKSHSQS